MLNSSLISILKAFSKEEIKWFRLFVESPYFNTSEATTKLYREIIKFYPEFKSRNFTKEYLFSKVYSKDKYQKDLFRKLVSNLIKLSEEFLSQRGLENNTFYKKLYRLKQYSDKSLISQFELLSKKLSAELEQDGIIDDNYFLKHSELSALLYGQKFYNLKKNVNQEYIRIYDFAMIDLTYKVLTYLRGHSVEKRIRNTYNDKSLVNEYMKYLDIENLIAMVIKHYPEYAWVIEQFYLCLKCHINPANEGVFINYKKYVFKNLSKFTLHEQSNLLVGLINIITYKTRDGIITARYANEQKFELMTLMIEKGYIDFVGYEVFIQLCCNLKRYKTAEDFISSHSSILKLSDPNQAILFGNMLIHYYKKDYKKAIRIASKITMNDLKTTFLTKHFLIKANIELGENEQAYYLLDTFSHFVRTKTVSEDRKDRHGNFIIYTKKYLELSLNDNEFEVQKTISEIQALRVADKEWLLRKLNGLINNNDTKN